MEDHKKHEMLVTILSLSPSELGVMDDILRSVIAYLHNNKPTAHTKKRIEMLKIIRGQLLFVRGGEGKNAEFLDKNDIRAIREAMVTFVQVTRRVVPQSSTRDQTLGAVNRLRRHIEQHLLA